MDPRLQTRIQRYGWDAAAPYYHDAWQSQLRPAHDRLLAVVLLEEGERVIESACGSGLITLRLAQQVGASGYVLATDISEAMLEDLDARLRAFAIGNVEIRRFAAEEIDVPNGSFDVAICGLGLMYTPHPGKAVQVMANAVRPGGRVAATVWGERRNCGWAEVFPIVDRRVNSEVCPLFFGTGGHGTLARLFAEAGLADIMEYRQSETLSYASDEDVADAVLLGGPVALAVKRFSEPVWQEVRREFLDSLVSCRKDDGTYSVPGEFVTVTGKRV